MKTGHFRFSCITLALTSLQGQAAAMPAAHFDEPVMTVTAPLSSPLEVSSSPKTPRQPVPASDGSDYLKTMPGFAQIRNGGTNGDPVFRGMFGSRLRILTNGGEMPGACPARMDAPTSYISPESFDTLSLIKGPQTVLWGPGNSAGTVRFDREPPQFSQPGMQGDASLLHASHHRWDENADLSVGSADGYLRVIGNHSRAGDYRDGSGAVVPSRWNKWNADVALGLTPDADTLWEVTAGRGNGDARYAGRSMDGSQFKRDSLGLRYKQSDIGEVFNAVEAQIYYNYANHIMDNYSLRSPGSGAMPMPMGEMGGMHEMGGMPGMDGMDGMDAGMDMDMSQPMAMQLDRRTVGGRAQGTWQWHALTLKSGMDAQTSTHRNREQAGWKKDARFHDVGLFSELTWHASARSDLIGGARLDRAWVDNFTGDGERARVTALPAGFLRLEHRLASQPVMFYAGLGYTERFPDYWELFSPTSGADGHSSAFDTVKTEKTTQLDIGAQYRGKRASGWISAWLGRIDDFILFDYDPHNRYISRVSNVDATTLGAEAGVGYQLTDNWSTDASLAFTRGENRSSHRPLPQIPPLEGRLALNWQSGDWSSSGLLRLVNGQHRIALNEGNVVGKDFAESHAFAVFSANVAWRVAPSVKLSSGVDNLFNRTYSEHLNMAGNSVFGYSANTPVNEPGRTWWAKVNVTF